MMKTKRLAASNRQSKYVKRIAKKLGADLVGTLPAYSAGAFGAAKLAGILEERLVPAAGKRFGRPTDPNWKRHPKVPMSPKTVSELTELALFLSKGKRRISPMQVAAQILEQGLESFFPRR